MDVNGIQHLLQQLAALVADGAAALPALLILVLVAATADQVVALALHGQAFRETERDGRWWCLPCTTVLPKNPSTDRTGTNQVGSE